MAPKDPGSGVCWMSWSVFPSKQDSIDASRSNDPHSKEAKGGAKKFLLKEKIWLTWTFFGLELADTDRRRHLSEIFLKKVKAVKVFR